MPKHIYITTPIYYVNDKPHIGHAYTSLACDVLARFKRLDGYKVRFLTGTDEHGQKVEKSAAVKGMDPQAFTDEVSQFFRTLAKTMNFSNDDFIRTTEPRHKKGAQAFWNILAKHKTPKGNDCIFKKKYGGWYSVRDEAFYTESELVNGNAPTGAPVEWVEEDNYFFRLSDYQDALLAFYENNPEFVVPKSRYNEVLSFVKAGLEDISISRTTFKWGIPVPGDEAHVMYVWLDALTNYITALGFPDTDTTLYQEFWNDGGPIHVVGKDILRFHAVYWPAFLMAADVALPSRIVAHGWWTNEGQKISKSLGNVIDPHALVEEFGLDQTRYFLMREVPFGNDGNYARDRMITVINTELANNIGNLVQRTLSMIQKNCGGEVPENGEFTEADLVLLDGSKALVESIRNSMDTQRFHEAIDAITVHASLANAYIDEQAPWTLKKEGKTERMQTVLYTLAETIRHIGLVLQAFMPDSASKILEQLALSEHERSLASIAHALKPGTQLPAPQGIFPRFNSEAA